MPDEPPDEGGFLSPLDELFVQGARFREPSAAERAAAARQNRRQGRRRRGPSSSRSVLIVVVAFVALVVAIKVFPAGSSRGDAGGGFDGAPRHVTVYYALPAGVQADARMPDEIRHDIAVAQNWFASETPGRILRVDNTDGAIDVRVRQLRATVPQLANQPNAVDLVRDEFLPADRKALDTIPLVFVPIVRHAAAGVTDCGVTEGAFSIVWVGSCGYRPSINSAWPGGDTKVIAHELLHALGAVAPCAPHYGHDGHVVDNQADIMYWNAERTTLDLIALDPGHDDYYDTGRKDCTDVSRHPAWTRQ